MGTFSEEITLVNERDEARVKAGILKEARQVTVDAVVDTRAITLCLNHETCDILGLDIKGVRLAWVADGRTVESKITSSVEIRWKDRSTACSAYMLPGAKNVLLGTIPLEGLDLVVDLTRRCLVGAHGDKPLLEVD